MADQDKQEHRQEQRTWLKLDPTINGGAILQILSLCALVGIYIVTTRGEVSRLSSQVEALNARFTEEVVKLSNAVDRLGTALGPFTRAQVEISQLERRVTGVETRNEVQEERLNRLGESLVETRTNIETILRASRQNLPGAPGIRR